MLLSDHSICFAACSLPAALGLLGHKLSAFGSRPRVAAADLHHLLMSHVFIRLVLGVALRTHASERLALLGSFPDQPKPSPPLNWYPHATGRAPCPPPRPRPDSTSCLERTTVAHSQRRALLRTRLPRRKSDGGSSSWAMLTALCLEVKRRPHHMALAKDLSEARQRWQRRKLTSCSSFMASVAEEGRRTGKGRNRTRSMAHEFSEEAQDVVPKQFLRDRLNASLDVHRGSHNTDY
jgi:hypothetical protein